MRHPHPSRVHVMVSYRRYILGEKINSRNHGRKFRTGARSLIHYREYVAEYLAAKRDVLRGEA